MSGYIGLGKSSKYTFYILIIFICQFISDLLLGFNNNNKDKKICFFSFIPNLKSHYLIKDFISYLSAILCGLIFYLLKNKIEMKKKGEISIRKREKFKKKFFRDKSQSINFILFLTSFLYSINTIIRSFLYSIIYYGEFWMLEIALIVILSKIILKIKIGNHQKVTVFLISGILMIFRIINCILPRARHSDCGNTEECKNKYLTDNNLLIIIYKKFGSYFYIPLIFIIYILIAIMRDYSWVKIKYLIDIKSVHYFKLFIFFGIIGSILVSITLIFISYIPCETLININQIYNETSNTYSYYDINENIKISFTTKLCNIEKYNENKKELELYYDNIFIYFEEMKDLNKQNLIEIFLIIPLFFILNAILHFSHIMLIRYFDPNMLLVSSNFYYFTQRLIEFIVNEGNEKYLTHIQFFLYEIEEIISIFANLIYMEVIELRFCKLDYDIKRNIELRADLECENLEEEDEYENNLDNTSTINNISLTEL